MLWFDLMFDVQVRRHRGEPVLPDDVLASIAAYYRRVTIDAVPMNRLVSVVMAVAVGGTILQLVRGAMSATAGITALALCSVPIGLALGRVFGAARRLGSRGDSIETQSELARQIYRDHVFCFVAIAGFILLQLVSG